MITKERLITHSVEGLVRTGVQILPTMYLFYQSIQLTETQITVVPRRLTVSYGATQYIQAINGSIVQLFRVSTTWLCHFYILLQSFQLSTKTKSFRESIYGTN